MTFINKLVWSVAISLIFLNSIYFSFKLKFPQLKFKKIKESLKNNDNVDGISTKDSLFISLGSKLGAGSLAGISFAIFYGGIGTIFWIWITTFFSSINCFIENILSCLYKEKDGKYCKGGPSFYIKKGLNNKKLSYIYSILAICAYVFGFLTIQNNTITKLVTTTYKVSPITISLIITIISLLLIFKGIKSISNACNKIVPFMTIVYIVLGIVIILFNITKVPTIIIGIIKSAFTIKSATGGIIYTFLVGVQKAIFAQEAGVGTSAIASGSNNNKNYMKQGFMGIIETYFIGIIITTVTAFLVILSNFENLNLSNINGIEITKYAFIYHFGKLGNIFLLIILILFAFSTIITCYYYGESNLKNLTSNKKAIFILKIISVITIFIGGVISSTTAWNIGDILIGILAIINIYSMFKLKGVIFTKVKKCDKIDT